MVLHHLLIEDRLYTLDTEKKTWSCIKEGQTEPNILYSGLKYFHYYKNRLFLGFDDFLGYFSFCDETFKELYRGTYFNLRENNGKYRFQDDQEQIWYIKKEKIYDSKSYVVTFYTNIDEFKITIDDIWIHKYEIPTDCLKDILIKCDNEALLTELNSVLRTYSEKLCHEVGIKELKEKNWPLILPLDQYEYACYCYYGFMDFSREYYNWSDSPMRWHRSEIPLPKPLACCRLDLNGIPLCLFKDGSFGYLHRGKGFQQSEEIFGYKLIDLNVKTLI